MNWRDRVQHTAGAVAEFLQDRWFDGTRDVRTAGYVSLRNAGVSPKDASDSELYIPARPANIRQALGETGISDFTGYSFVDLGSGKGRALFVAAELPFEQVIGVELSASLHAQACANIYRLRRWYRRCERITSVCVNARDFVFPERPLILYLFNPFGAETVQHVLDNLQASLERQPRHVAIVLLWPRCGDQVAAMKGMRLRSSTRRHQVFEFLPSAT